MGINKQFRVSFDLTATMSNEQEQALLDALLECARESDFTDPRLVRILKLAITEGHEAAFAAVVTNGIRQFIRECTDELTCDEVSVRVSPAKVQVKR